MPAGVWASFGWKEAGRPEPVQCRADCHGEGVVVKLPKFHNLLPPMNTFIRTLVASAVFAAAAHAQTLYLTDTGTTIRRSTDGGSNWSGWVTQVGASFRGVTLDGAGNVLATDSANDVVRAYTNAGSAITTTGFGDASSFNQRPVGFFGGYVYVNSGAAGGAGIEDGSATWNGTGFGSNPLGAALDSGWQGNDMAFASAGGTDYHFLNGTSAASLRRRTVLGNGTLSTQTSISLTGPSTDTRDLLFTASGRLMVLNDAGLWLSGTGQVTSTSVSLTNVFSFSGTENSGTGDMGLNGRDFALVGNTLYAVSNTNLYRYTVDDALGTIAFTSANAHGFNSANLQLAAVPEPGVTGALALGLLAAGIRRRRD